MPEVSKNALLLNEYITSIVRAYRVLDTQVASSPTQSLTKQELFVIEHLGSSGPSIMSGLAEYLGIAVNTATTVVDALERKGVVRRERAAENRRKVWVQLTPAGRRVYQVYLAEQSRAAEFLLSSLTPEEQQIYMVLMKKIGQAADALPPHSESQ